MLKTIVRVILGAIMVLGLVVSASACAAKPEPEYAGPITEDILIGMNENDYAKFSEHFDEDMKVAFPETAVILPELKATIGDYIPESREFWKVTTSGIYANVFYKTKFTKESANVVVKVVFREIDGEMYVSGLWFDSPKLRGQ
jgi:hypothetical protein